MRISRSRSASASFLLFLFLFLFLFSALDPYLPRPTHPWQQPPKHMPAHTGTAIGAAVGLVEITVARRSDRQHPKGEIFL